MKEKCAFITGLEGFTGKYLEAELTHQGYTVMGICRPDTDPKKEHIFPCDINDRDNLISLLKQLRPNFIINLAGISFVKHAEESEMQIVNYQGACTLLDAVYQSRIPVQKILLISSGHVYGNQQIAVISEDDNLEPVSQYGMSKLKMEEVAKTWFSKLPIIIARSFNYTGIGQSEQFLPAKIVGHYVRKEPSIELGNTQVARDWCDVRDVVTVYRLLLESIVDSSFINVCSGISYRLAYILDLLSEVSCHKLNVKTLTSLIRPNEIIELKGNNRKLLSIIGDIKFRPLKETLTWMYQGLVD